MNSKKCVVKLAVRKLTIFVLIRLEIKKGDYRISNESESIL